MRPPAPQPSSRTAAATGSPTPSRALVITAAAAAASAAIAAAAAAAASAIAAASKARVTRSSAPAVCEAACTLGPSPRRAAVPIAARLRMPIPILPPTPAATPRSAATAVGARGIICSGEGWRGHRRLGVRWGSAPWAPSVGARVV
jgi:hypothetical protein